MSNHAAASVSPTPSVAKTFAQFITTPITPSRSGFAETCIHADASAGAQLSDIAGYRSEFVKLFGFGLAGVDYEAEANPVAPLPSAA